MRMAHGAPMRTSNRSRDNRKAFQGRSEVRIQMSSHGMLSDEQMLRVCKRFYVALILSRLVQVKFFYFKLLTKAAIMTVSHFNTHMNFVIHSHGFEWFSVVVVFILCRII